MCNSDSLETPEHILLHCQFAKSVRSLTPYADIIEHDSNSLINLQDWVVKWISDNRLKDKVVVVFTIAWSIWKDRCSCVFQGKSLNHHVTARLAVKLVTDTETFLDNVISQEYVLAVSTEEKNLSMITNSLPDDCVLVFSDAAYDKNTNLSGIGLIMLNIAGSFIGCKLKAGSVRNAEEAESLALLEAVTWAKAKRLEKVCVISDAKTVIDAFNSTSNQIFWYNKSVLEDCKTISSCVHLVKFEFLKRDHIILADQAAKFSGRTRTSGEWMGNVPDFLNSKM
ncbi:uncharacterized protein LOC113279206 [Papaver somniferum]|uniref:uncharacterized protein LOC113279206 n=1 Tax=Papaver somniferum TaxID=3469 RepID=UPI000E6F55B3|nr:uncharacterized protein LOC113279206 [Papaver somniferum]